MKIAVVHNSVAPEDPPDDQDVLLQAESVAAAASDLGHRARIFSCSLDLEAAKIALTAFSPDLVFNLVEALDGSCRLLPFFPALCDRLGMAYTGSSATALWVTTQKVLAKERLAAAGVPTPAWIGPVPAESSAVREASDAGGAATGTWIVKSLWEHASFGMNGDVLVFGADGDGIRQVLYRRTSEFGGACFAEAFIDGREFNLSLLQTAGRIRVLPPAEIVFEGFGKDRPRIVDYRAKWNTDSYEYHHTPRRFDSPAEDRPLLRRLQALALRCWDLFGLTGYARVDFRVDEKNRPWVLEVNANPCLSPDAGFAAALAEAGIPYQKAVQCILASATRRGHHKFEARNSKSETNLNDKNSNDRNPDHRWAPPRESICGKHEKVSAVGLKI
jgi:D-alanine-D-alanine ligase